MAATPLFSILMCQDSMQPTVKSSLHCEKGTIVENLFPSQKVFGCFPSSIMFNSRKKWLALSNRTEFFSKTRMKKGGGDFMVNNGSMPFQNFTEMHSYDNCAMYNYLQSFSNGISLADKTLSEPYLLATGCNARQLKSLDSYFSKLHDDMNEEHTSCVPTSDFGSLSDTGEYQTGPSSSLGQKIRSIDNVDQPKAKTGLGSLQNYFDKLSSGVQTRETTSSPFTKDDTANSLIKLNVISEEYFEKTSSTLNTDDNHVSLESMNNETAPTGLGKKAFQGSQPYDEASDFYLINLLASVDIAVFLFEIASPIRSSDVEQLSLPLIYGAKINKLILDGEWWRIVTPMFLVQD